MTQANPVEKEPAKKVKSQIYELDTDKRTLIGRSDNCHIHINKPAISGEHAFIFYEQDDFWVEDNKSSNGTRLNGLPITGKSKLSLNDVVRVGDYTFTLVREFSIEKGGNFHYLEIRKIKQRGGASYPSTDSIKMKVDEDVKSKALEDFKKKISSDDKSAEKKKETGEQSSKPEKEEKTSDKSKGEDKSLQEDDDELILEAEDSPKKKGEKKKSSKKKSSEETRTSKKKAYFKRLGAGVALKLKSFELSKQAVLSRLKEIVVISIICHIAAMYLADKFLNFGGDKKKENKEIIMTLKDEEIMDEIRQDMEVEEIEPTLQDAAPANLTLDLDIDAKVTSSSEVLAEAMEDTTTGTVNVLAGAGAVGDIVIGRGQKGVRDAAFRKRVLGAKGRYSGVDIRATLIWNTLSDLDLHCTTPSGDDIYYGVKELDGGVLDIDKNATDPVSNPVENIIFQKAGDGDYVIELNLFESRNVEAVPFKIEFVIFGDVFYYKGILTKRNNEKSKIEIVNFSCKNGKYRINSYINQKAPEKMPEVELDLVEP
ncbi:MAG: FHA domain-containing protein [Lentisphaerales bacterium]|nr:FHA domain-containing protein [Lentisphaerales bacterium]